MGMDKQTRTVDVILETAQKLVQEFGFNGFSYAHIAEILGIRTASIHYYFPNKEDLGEALIARYYKNFTSAIAQIDAMNPNSLEKLSKFMLLYSAPVQDHSTCMGVMLSTDLATLSSKTQDGVAKLFIANLEWLESVMEQGRQEGHLKFDGSAVVQAHRLLASLQGAQLLAGSYRDSRRFEKVAEGLLTAFTS